MSAISVDTNILFHGFTPESVHHERAKGFLHELSSREDVVLSELVLSEFYLLLRNPAVLSRPLNPQEAVAVVASYRSHPRWRLSGFPPRSAAVHDEMWRRAGESGFVRRKIYDVRMALCLRSFGVTEFATANVRDFDGLGFTKVWNPFEKNQE